MLQKQSKILLLGGVLLSVISATLALGIHSLNLGNQIKTSTVSGRAEENTAFKNTGKADVFLRVSWSEVWQYEENGEKKLLSNRVDGNEVAVKQWSDVWKGEWTDGGDGWFYYNKILKAGDITRPVLDTVNFREDAGMQYKNADYQLFFQMEMVQASREYQVCKDAVQTVFGKVMSIKKGATELNWKDMRYNAILHWETEVGNESKD